MKPVILGKMTEPTVYHPLLASLDLPHQEKNYVQSPEQKLHFLK